MHKLFYSLLLLNFLITSCKESQKLMENNMYSGINISDSVSLTRDKYTKEATLKIDINVPWSLYTGSSVDDIDQSKPILESNKAGSYTLHVNDSTRSYFKLISPYSTLVFAERLLPMEGGYNFRDLGGLQNKDGKIIKWGKLFRSDDLNNLTNADLNYLSSIPLTTIVDFRSTQEIDMAPDLLPRSVTNDFELSISPGNLMDGNNFITYSSDQVDTLMMQLNVLLVADSLSIAQYKKFFELLQEQKDLPLLYHCSAGKDRTGMATALILFALGVDQTIIMNDYLSSNVYLSGKYSQYVDKYPNLKAFFEVKKEFLKAGIDYVIKEHGSVENYLTQVLNVDLNKMKDIYLY